MIEHAVAWLKSQQSEMVRDLILLANQNSGSENLPGLQQVASWLQCWADLKGASFQQVSLPARAMVNASGDVMQQETAPALRWDYQADCSERVLLAIHYDTVFSSQNAFQECHWIDEYRLSGPGVADAKGGIVVLVFALRALIQFQLAPNLGWTLLLNPDEEVGSPSSVGLFERIAGDFEFGLLFEPALPSGELVAERKGSGNFTVVVRGRSAHAGRHFEDGRNALAALCRFLVQLDDLNGVRPGLTINIGSIQGGGAVNVVPDLAIGRFNVRMSDQSSVEWFNQELERRIAELNSLDGINCQLSGGIASPPKTVTPEMRKLMQRVELAAREALSLRTAEPAIRWMSTGGVCDGNKLAAFGLPNVDTLGPIGDGLHSSMEWVDTRSLVTRAEWLIRLLHDYSNELATTTTRRQ